MDTVTLGLARRKWCFGLVYVDRADNFGLFIFIIINLLFIQSTGASQLFTIEANSNLNTNIRDFNLQNQATFKEQQQNNDFNNYFNEPQPLVFHDSGSGLGASSSLNQFSSNQLRPDLSSSSSSSISPSLIMAKCWNNYENDNDCKDLNFITANSNTNSANQATSNNNQNNQDSSFSGLDDSLITPVLIFESSSPISISEEEEQATRKQQSEQFYSTPPDSSLFNGQAYFSSSSSKPPAIINNNNNNIYNTVNKMKNQNNRQPPPQLTANDVYAAPPAGATILLPSTTTTSTSTTEQYIYKKPFVTTTPPVRIMVTSRPANVFVATPKSMPKTTTTTTTGRKCQRDGEKNDADCDEEPDSSSGDNENDRKNIVKSDNDDSDDDPDDDDDNNKAGNNNSTDNDDSDSDNRIINNEFGSGDGMSPNGDNEASDDDNTEDDDDDPDNNNLSEGSGVSESPTSGNVAGDRTAGRTGSSRFVQITSSSLRPPTITVTPLATMKSTMTTMTSTTTTSPKTTSLEATTQEDRTEASIEVVVHPTLPPTFPITTTSKGNGSDMSPSDIDGDFIQQQLTTTTGPNDIMQTLTSTTIMPDDTFKSKPVFPSANQPANNNNNNEEDDINNNQIGAGGQNQNGGLGSQDLDNIDQRQQQLANQTPQTTTTTEMVDLATFKQIPMPTMEPAYPPRFNFKNSEVSASNSESKQNSDNSQAKNDQEDNNKIADKHKLYTNSITGSPPIKLENPWREKAPVTRNQFMQQLDRLDSTGQIGLSQQQQQQQLNNNNQHSALGRARTNDQISRSQSLSMNSEDFLSTIVYIFLGFICLALCLISIAGYMHMKRRKAYRTALLGQKQPLGLPSQFIGGDHQHLLMKGNGNGIHHQIVVPAQGAQLGGQLVGGPGSQLMGSKQQQQQPGLLSTYAPAPNGAGGGGLILRGSSGAPAKIAGGGGGGNVKTSTNGPDLSMDIINGSTEDNEEEISAGEEDNEPEDNLDQLIDDNDNNNNNNGVGMGQRRAAKNKSGTNRQSSWSTEDQTTSSGSQRTADSSQQQEMGIAGSNCLDGHNQQLPAHQMQPVRASQYANSLSDGRQNSSSISDSNSMTPPEGAGVIPAPTYQGNQQSGALSGQQQPLQQPSMQPGAPFQPHHQNQQPANVNVMYNQQYMNQNPNLRHRFPVPPSRSVENLNHHFGPASNHPQGFNQTQQAGLFMNQPTGPSFGLPQNNNIFNKPPPPMPPYLNNMNGLPERPPLMEQGQAIYADNNASNQSYAGNNHIRMGPFQHQQRPPSLTHQHHLASSFDGQSPTISQARIAMNPLATMSRRYPAGSGLNRGVYSEDSSSFITASPSLARTSSSSSFAFTNNAGSSQITTPIREKPAFEDYALAYQHNNGLGIDLNNGARKQQQANSRNVVRYL